MWFKSFIQNLRHHTLAYILNILRLTLAFATFIIIAAQLRYDLSFDRFHKDSDRIYRLERTYQDETGFYVMPWINFPLAEDIIASSPYIEAGTVVCPFMGESYVTVENSHGDKNGYNVHFVPVTPDIVKIFEFKMVEGSADALYEPGSALIPLSTAKKLFPNTTAIGKSIVATDGIYMCTHKDLTVKGVYKDFPENSQLGQNGVFVQMDSQKGARNNRQQSNFNLYLKLSSSDPDITSTVTDSYKEKFTREHPEEYLNEIRFVKLSDVYYNNDSTNDPYAIHGQRSTSLTLAGIVLLILLIAAVNFTNFSLAMIPFRIKSVNTRKVLGSSVTRLRMEMIADALMSVLLAFIVSIALVYGIHGTSLKEVIIADFNPFHNYSILGITALIALFIGIIAELYPSRYITSFPPALVLKGSFGLSGRGRILRRVLLAGQFIISIVLIAMALIINKQNAYMRSTDIGVNKDRVVMMSVGAGTYQKREAILERLRQLPQVQEVAFTDEKICATESYQNWGLDLGDNINYETIMIPVSWNMLHLLGVNIEEGRDFMRSDEQTEDFSLIVTRTTQKNVGMEVRSYNNQFNIVGICSDVHVMSLRRALANTTFYVNKGNLGSSGFAYIKIKDGEDLVRTVQELRKAYSEMDPYYPVDVEFFDTALEGQYKSELVFEKTIDWCTILAILISMLGIFGLIFFDTQQRRKEMSVRRIMGAEVSDILWNINRPYLILLGLSYAAAVPVVIYFSSIWMTNFQYRAPIGPGVYILSLLIILAVTLLTINIQAWRSVRTNPVDSIKIE